jgi:cell wall-associated NlpC family hydrolase
MHSRIRPTLFLLALLLAQVAHAEGFDAKLLGFRPEKQNIQYWIEQAAKNSRDPIQDALLQPAEVEALNGKLRESEPTFTDIFTLPEQMSAAQINERINRISKRPALKLVDADGVIVSESRINKLFKNINLPRAGTNQQLGFGLITKRSALRAFPTDLRVFNQPGNTDIDRFQESALFPGTPVAVLRHSKDRQWLFVVSELYSAWIREEAVALGSRSEVAGYAISTPRLVITDSKARTAFTPQRPEISELVLDMGIALPWHDQWPLTEAVNGQGSLGSKVITLPTRDTNGRLSLTPALIANHYKTSARYLDMSVLQLLLQSSQFIGERYGWGHDYGSRDCSGFVSEIYRSMGILLPRNTSDQAKTTVFERETFDAALSRDQRIERVRQLNIGDLVYIPGHVMMVIGHDEYGPWVIHDSHGTGFIQNGLFHPVPSNGVTITPLLSMAFSADKLYIDAISGIQHIIPKNRFEQKP